MCFPVSHRNLGPREVSRRTLSVEETRLALRAPSQPPRDNPVRSAPIRVISGPTMSQTVGGSRMANHSARSLLAPLSSDRTAFRLLFQPPTDWDAHGSLRRLTGR